MYHNKLSKQLVLVTTFQDMYVTVPYLSGAPVKASVHPLNPGITPSHQDPFETHLRDRLCCLKKRRHDEIHDSHCVTLLLVVT